MEPKTKRKIYKKKRLTVPLIILAILLVARLLLPYFVKNYVNKVLSDIPGYYGHVEDIDISLTQEEVRNYVQSINCNTVIDTKIADFNRMRAVCRDGSYVEMANNGDSINNVLDPSPIEVEIESSSSLIKFSF